MLKRYNTVGRISLPYGPGTHCLDWDGPCPSYLTDKRTGNTFGRLMPVLSYSREGIDQLLGHQRHS